MLYLLLAEGFEETEALAPADVIRRAGLEVQLAGVTGPRVTGAHGIEVTTDIPIGEIDLETLEGLILPGGMPGTLNLQQNDQVEHLIRRAAEEKKLIAAICAAPMILGELGLLEGRAATCFPGYEENLSGAELKPDPVVCDGPFITARGAGVSLQFGAAIVDYFIQDELGGSKGRRILKQMQMDLEG